MEGKKEKIPEFQPGDIVEIAGKPHMVTSVIEPNYLAILRNQNIVENKRVYEFTELPIKDDLTD